MFTKTCATCLKQFETKKAQADICYDCVLKRITGGHAPEEGDFNTARLVSGTLTDEEEGWLRSDLQAVEGGRTLEEEAYDFYGHDPDIYDDEEGGY